MKQEMKDYIRYRMERSRQSLTVARYAFEQDHLQDAVNRLYYACFYLVSALLFTEGMTSPKHTGIRSLFHRNWINTKRLPPKYGEFYQQLFKHRQEGDYDDYVYFRHDDVANWFHNAEEFIAVLSETVETQLTREEPEEGTGKANHP